MRHVLHTLDARQWFDRFTCHGNFLCCRAVDERDCPSRLVGGGRRFA